MMKPKRPKVIKAKLEKELERYSKRIQKLASRAYQIRTMLEDLALMEQSLTATGKEEILKDFKEETNALHNEGSQGQTGNWTADPNAGQPDISDSIIAAAVLAEQPTELRDNSGDAGKSEGSGV